MEYLNLFIGFRCSIPGLYPCLIRSYYLNKMPSRLRTFCLQIFILCSLVHVTLAQADLGIILGISNYQGELSSHSTENGFKALISPVVGIHTGLQLNPYFQLRGDLMYTRLSGDDELNEKESVRLRNLDFFSPILQLAMGADWNILGFNIQEQKAFTPFITAGASLFYINPMTTYEGKKIALHPLGTEGQYLDGYPEQKPYSHFQPSLQFGGGLKMLTGKFILSVESIMSYTFTDYIDDVSTIYITYPELYEAGPLTAALANRQGEYLNSEPVVVPSGTQRGNPETNDIFGMITIRVGIPILMNANQSNARRNGSKTIKCPKF